MSKKILVLSMMALVSGCTGFQAETPLASSKSSNPWSQGTVTDSSSTSTATTMPDVRYASCSISLPALIMQDQELRLVIVTQGIAKVQVSVNGSEYGDLGTVNGALSWPGNSFDPGNYNLNFRSFTSSKQVVACDPVKKVVTIAAVATTPTIPSIPDTPSVPTNPPINPQPSPPVTVDPPPVTGGIYSDYVSHMGVGQIITQDFKNLHKPASLVTRVMNNQNYVEIFYDGAGSGNMGTGNARKKLKFFVPPGTAAMDAGMYLFLCPSDELRGLWKMYSPPVSSFASISTGDVGGSHSEDTFRKLADKKEKPFYSPPTTGNFLVISSPNDVETPLSQGGYLYSHFQYPCGDFQRLSLRLYVRKDCYERWFNSVNTKWDAQGNPAEDAVHTCQ